MVSHMTTKEVTLDCVFAGQGECFQFLDYMFNVMCFQFQGLSVSYAVCSWFQGLCTW